MQIAPEELAQAINCLDSEALGRLAKMLQPEAARSLIGAAVRAHPPRRSLYAFERVCAAIGEAGDGGIKMAELTRRLRMPAAVIRQELAILIARGEVEDEPDDHAGPGRPAVRFRLVRQGPITSVPRRFP